MAEPPLLKRAKTENKCFEARQEAAASSSSKLSNSKVEEKVDDKVSPTRSDLERLEILRDIDYEAAAQALIQQGKAGWRYDTNQTSTTNLQHFFSRYTLTPKSEPYKIEVTAIGQKHQDYQAALKTVLSKEIFVG